MPRGLATAVLLQLRGQVDLPDPHHTATVPLRLRGVGIGQLEVHDARHRLAAHRADAAWLGFGLGFGFGLGLGLGFGFGFGSGFGFRF